MIYSIEIVDEVCRLRLQGMSVLKISHAVSRSFPRYCQKSRKQKNFCSEDVLKIIQLLKADGRLPANLLDDLKKTIGEKGKFKSNRPKNVTPPLTFNF